MTVEAISPPDVASDEFQESRIDAPVLKSLDAAHYRRVLRPLLPDEFFAPRPSHLWRLVVQLAIIAACYVTLRFWAPWWSWPMISLIIGHSLACLAFVAHDL